MKILVAIDDPSPEGFNWTRNKEPVQFGFACARDKFEGRSCGCSRSWTGIATLKAATLAVVVESNKRADPETSCIAAALPVGTRVRCLYNYKLDRWAWYVDRTNT